MTDAKQYTLKDVFRFWLPLATNWQIMACEGPLLTALIARMPSEKYNLAAFGITWAISIFIESPEISLLSTTAALLQDQATFFKLRRFMHLINAICTLCMALLVIPQVFHVLAANILNLPPEIERLVHQATIIMILWPGAIGYRRFYQGVMIRHNQTGRVAIGAFIRIGSLAACGFSLFFWSHLDGASIGTASLVAGVCGEAIASRIMAGPTIKLILSGAWPAKNTHPPLTNSVLLKFYIPFTLTIFLGTAMQPLSTFAVGRSYLALDSLAALPVAGSIIWFVTVSALGIQESSIVMIGRQFENFAILKKFTIIVGSTLSALLFVVGFTPLSALWFRNVSGLSPDLVGMAQIVLCISFLSPILRAIECLQRSIMMTAHKTHFLTVATILEVASLAACLFITIYLLNMTGAYASALSGVLCVVVATLYLAPHTRRALNSANNNAS